MRYGVISLLAVVLSGCGLPAVPLISAAAATGVAIATAISASNPRAGARAADAANTARLYCGIPAAAGPLTVALISAADPAAAPIAVTTKQAVDAACALAGGIAVAPPVPGVGVPVVAIPGPVAVVAMH